MTKNKETGTNSDKKILIAVIAIPLIIIGALTYFAISKKSAPAEQAVGNQTAPTTGIDIFAQCIKDSGAKLYGASWCSHCQNQKKLFGNSKNLPYVECATPDGKGQEQVCADAKIKGYPTWIFADGSRQSGELSFEILSQKTGCQIPQ
ncbi:MAG: hypothetical protein HGA61_04095 [Candidatus Moranbacteria bacterium]|nr:hypothetical protein [Candidatus Moranbacteria bacterium]